MNLSTRHLAGLPAIPALRRLCQSLAMLDAILSPEWADRVYSFNAHWASNEMMASMRTSSGDDFFLLFTPAGAILKGFAHESLLSPYAYDPPCIWPGVLDQVPAVFAPFLAEPAFSLEETSFCIWRQTADRDWQCGVRQFPDAADPDGSAALLRIFDGQPATYQTFAEDYYGMPVPLEAVTYIYQHLPLTTALIHQLNPDNTLSDLSADIEEIQYRTR